MQSDSGISEEQLSALVDAEVSDGERQVLGDQIASDAQARAAADDFARIKEMLGSMATPEAPPGFWESVEAGVRGELAESSVSVLPNRGRAKLVGIVSAAAVLVALLFAGVLVSSGDNDTQVAGPATQDSAPQDEPGAGDSGQGSSDTPAVPDPGDPGTSDSASGAADQAGGSASDDQSGTSDEPDVEPGVDPDGEPGVSTPTAVTAQSAPTLLFPQTLLVTTTTTTSSTTSTTTSTTLP